MHILAWSLLCLFYLVSLVTPPRPSLLDTIFLNWYSVNPFSGSETVETCSVILTSFWVCRMNTSSAILLHAWCQLFFNILITTLNSLGYSWILIFFFAVLYESGMGWYLRGLLPWSESRFLKGGTQQHHRYSTSLCSASNFCFIRSKLKPTQKVGQISYRRGLTR